MDTVFHWDGQAGTAPGTAEDEFLVWDCAQNTSHAGHYFEHNGEPFGPFVTANAAQKALSKRVENETPKLALAA